MNQQLDQQYPTWPRNQRGDSIVLVTLTFFNDASAGAKPAGIFHGPNLSNEWTVDIKRDDVPLGNVTDSTTEKIDAISMLQYMASLTWDDIKDWEGYDMHLNGTWASRQAASEYAATGGDFGLGGIDSVAANLTVSGGKGSIPSSWSSVNSNGTNSSLGHQNFRSKPRHADILDLGTSYILSEVASHSSSNSTSVPVDTIGARAVGSHGHKHGHRHISSRIKREAMAEADSSGISPVSPITPLNKRDGPVQCGPGSPCLDESCCSADGKCGYKEAHCGDGCLSNCDATAMCGIDSADSHTPCALNLCCSYYGWCGTESVHCYDPEPQYGVTPCQAGYGACTMYPPPSCSGTSASSGRRVGYYQGWNVRERQCDTVTPSQINTKGLTHLFYAFVFFDPDTFQMIAMHPDDVTQYTEFTALASNSLQTWVAVGGWSFSDPGPTHTAWSDMVSTSGNRAAFIASLLNFMEMYGFQGADLDWEYPADEDRGGSSSDADNLVLLVQEMREAFGSRFGLSLTLAPDYWYLRGFKPSAMQPYVDFMGFMAYDLHGPWDTDVAALGKQLGPKFINMSFL